MHIFKRTMDYVLRKLSLDEVIKYMSGWKYSHEFDRICENKKIFFLMTPTYGNLGDQAIEIATDEFLKDFFQEYSVIKIHLEDAYKYMKAIQKAIIKGDFIVIQGGGNFGSYYKVIEKTRCFIFSKLKDYPIFSMPSSVIYEENARGKRRLRKMKRCIEKCRTLTLASRDKYSYDCCKQMFSKCSNLLVPDMVLYHRNDRNPVTRNLLVLCMRTDREKRSDSIRNELIKNCYGNEMIIFDTSVDRNIEDCIKKEEVEAALNLFNHAYLVVTDRLHGMIFSAITGTRCIAMPSSDNKIKGVYGWIKENTHVQFIETPDVDYILEQVVKHKRENNSQIAIEYGLETNFEEFAKFIRKIVNNEDS